MAEHKKLRASFEEIQNRVEMLTQQLQQVGQAFMQLQRGLGGNGEVLSAVVSILGENLVQDEMNRMRKERQEAQEAQQAKGVKDLLDFGVLVPAETSTATSFIVGTDTFKDGRVVRVQFEVSGVADAERAKYIGLKAGSSVDGEQVKMTVAEVYNIDQAKAEAFAKAQQEKMAAAQAAAQPAVVPAPVAVEVEAAPAAEALADASGPQAAGPAPEPTPAQ